MRGEPKRDVQILKPCKNIHLKADGYVVMIDMELYVSCSEVAVLMGSVDGGLKVGGVEASL